ncbi:MAG: P-type conjugative transfer protein TrbJ [Rhodomicrobium sp.]
MMRLLKRAALGAAWMVVASFATPGLAQTVYCTNCSSEITQLLNLARLVDQLSTQGNILQTNNNQFLNMTTNTTPLASYQWGTGQSNIVSLNSILSGSSSLSYASANLASALGQKYSDYNAYVSAQPTSATAGTKGQQWSSDTNASVLSTLKAGNLQSTQILGDEQGTISGLRTQTAGAQGNLQALQTLAQIGLSNVEQLQKVRQLILTDTSLQANAIQTRSDRETFEQAAWRTFIKTPTIQTSGGARF